MALLRNLIPDMPTPGNAGTYIATPPAPVQWAKPKASSAPKKTTTKTPEAPVLDARDGWAKNGSRGAVRNG